ncbi:unnamed protein product [Calypogeia fissa]
MEMAWLLEQPSCSSLSSSSAYSSSFTSLGASSNRSSLAWVSTRYLPSASSSSPASSSSSSSASSTSSRSSNLSWGRRKQTNRSNKADHLIPASLLMEERGGSGKEAGVAMTIFKENLINTFEQTGLCREDELLGQQNRLGADNGSTSSSNYGNGSAMNRAAEVTESIRGSFSSAAVAGEDKVWLQMRAEARQDSDSEPALASYLYSTIMAHKSLERALAFHLGNKLSSATFLSTQLVSVFIDTIMDDQTIRESIRLDIVAVRERDPACVSYSHCLLNFKGFLALQAHRVAHRLWTQGRRSLALAMQSRVSEVFHVDIHPAAVVGSGILFDHATGVVVGETAVIGNNVSILHHVTLGGTGKTVGDRHPKIGDGVLIGAGATILGPIIVGEGAKIGAGSVVLTDIPPHTTAVGNPARLVGGKNAPRKSKDNPSETMDHTSFMSHWSDYVI